MTGAIGSLTIYLCAVDGVVMSRDCEEVACAKEDSCKGIHVHCRSSLDYNYAQIHVVDCDVRDLWESIFRCATLHGLILKPLQLHFITIKDRRST